MSKAARSFLAVLACVLGACSDESSQPSGQLQSGAGGVGVPMAGVTGSPLPAAGAGTAGTTAAAGSPGAAGSPAAGAAGLPTTGAAGTLAAGSGGAAPLAGQSGGGAGAPATGGVAGMPGTGSAGVPAAGGCGTESFAAIYRDIFMNTVYACGSAACHGRVSALPSVGNLDLSTAATAYAGLVGKNSDSEACAGKPRVIAGNPSKSMLVQKLREATLDCGNIMPLGSDPITEDELMRIVRWIQGGACNN